MTTGPKPYLNRLLAISDMLNSPMQKVREEAYRLLSELWQEYREDPDFPGEIEQLAGQNPAMLAEIARQSQLFDAGFNELIAGLLVKTESELAEKNAVSKKEVDKRFYILTDQPAGADKLNYNRYADAFAELVCNPDMITPITVGIYGAWGKGKTFLMRKIRESINNRVKASAQSSPAGTKVKILNVEFNAWSYSTSEHLWAGMVTHLYNEIEKYLGWRVGWDRFTKALKKSWRKALGLSFFYILLGLGLSLLFESQPIHEKWKALRVVITTLGASLIGGSALATFPILWSALKDFADTLFLSRAKNLQTIASRPDFHEQIGIMADIKGEISFMSGLLNKSHTRLVLFIDDLDRCNHKKAVEVLQSIMLLLSDKDGAPFVIFLGIDARVMVHAIEENYGEVLVKAGITGYEYLDKIVQLPFSIPYTNPDDLRNYVETLLWSSEDEKKSVEDKQPASSTEPAPAPQPEAPPPPVQEPPKNQIAVPVTFSKAEREAVLNCVSDFCDNPRKIKRIINMYRLARLLAPKTVHEPGKIIRWLLMTEQWPHHTAWIIHSVEDDLQMKKVVPETSIQEVYNRVRMHMQSEEMQKAFSIDYDPTLFDVFIEKDPHFTVLDILNLLPATFNLNPAIRWEVDNYANRLIEDAEIKTIRSDEQNDSHRI